MLLEWLVNICMLPSNLTLMQFFVSCVIGRVPLVEVCYINQLLICLSLVLVILIGLEVGLIDGPLLAIVPLLVVVILLLGIEKSLMLLPTLVLKLNIEK